MPQTPPIEIRVEQLHKQFDDRPVLRGVDLTIHCGQMVAILGSSGGGKTVLLQHLIGHYRPDRGRVLVADHDAPGDPLVDLASLDEDAMDRLRLHWAVVFQPNALFSGSVYENIALWMREVKLMEEPQIRPRVIEALRAVGLDADAVMSRDRSKLSGGMAKRVAIARAIAMRPRVIFYDEPTTGLDPSLATQIQDLILQMHEEPATAATRTTIIITHDTQLLRRLQPRIVLLHEGRIVFDGQYDQFRERAGDMAVIRPYIEQMPTLHMRSTPHA